MTMQKQPILRQGDVLLTPIKALPAGCSEVPLDKGRIVLAYGEVTGHAHAIADHRRLTAAAVRVGELDAEEHAEAIASELAKAAITRARLWRAPSGERYLEVREPVTITHEEHTAHTIPPGIYQVPTQVEYIAPELTRQVAD